MFSEGGKHVVKDQTFRVFSFFGFDFLRYVGVFAHATGQVLHRVIGHTALQGLVTTEQSRRKN